MKIWTVDAFASTPFTGNPAAVTVVDEFPNDDLCQKIAAEMNLSETVFVKILGKNRFHIRWLTPTVEVDLCGHGTLAAAHILFTEGFVEEVTKGIGRAHQIIFESRSGPLVVNQKSTGLVMDFPLHKTGERLSLEIFEGLFERDLIVDTCRSSDVIIVELASGDAVRTLDLDMNLVKALDCVDLIVTAKGDAKEPYDFISRVFAPRVGIDEDPVTGSAHCHLADYWQQKLGKTEFMAYQASKRGGALGLRIQGDRLHIKGQALTMLEGEFKGLSHGLD